MVLGLLVTAAAAGLAQPQLAPFQPLLGRCWAGEVAKGSVDTHCFTAVFNGQHVRDRHEVVVAGKTVYAGETLYSVAGVVVLFTYWNSMGGVGHGTARLDAGAWSFSGSMRASPKVAPLSYQTFWEVRDGGYLVRNGQAPAVSFHPVADRQP